MYWYVLSTYQYIIFLLIWYCISFVSAGYIRARTEDFWVHTLQFLRILRACRELPVSCRLFMHWNTHSTKAHYIRFINCCLAAPLPVPASARHHDWALARWLAGGCSCGWSALHDSQSSSSEMMISNLLTSSANPSQWCIARGEWTFEGLGAQVVALMSSSNWMSRM
jgi:hypothetical protein